MPKGRKELEEFEQFLLLLYRRDDVCSSLPSVTVKAPLLPDGQAGCWAFRLTAASRLPLTALDFIEFDMLASAIESGLRIAYTQPLKMTSRVRHSSAGTDPVAWSIGKIAFIEPRLGLSKRQLAEGWIAFKRRFHKTRLIANLPVGYEKALAEYCGPAWAGRMTKEPARSN